jgi:hypothetical protein
MAMHDAPFAVLAPEHCGLPQRVRRGCAAPDLGVVSLDLDDLCELRRCAFRDAFKGDDLALAQLRGGAL